MVNEDNNSSINFITDEIIENIAIRNIHNILNNNMQSNNQEARINNLLSRRYFNSPPRGGYLINYINSENSLEEDNSEYYENYENSENYLENITYFINNIQSQNIDDLISETFLDTVRELYNNNILNFQNSSENQNITFEFNNINNNNNNFNISNGYKKIKESDNELLNSQCPICIDPFKINECYRKLCCNHIFHKKCIDRWIKKDKNECPMCRSNIY